MKNEKLIVVTGAAGMIGSCVVRKLNDLGFFNLLLVDDLKTGLKWKNLVGKQFYELISKHQLIQWLVDNKERVDAILHLGACSDTVEMNADYLLENNTRYTIRLAEWALNANKRFIYASSAATYGDGSLGFADDPDLLERLTPMNMYAYSKHLVDLWMKREGVLNQVVALKYFNVFGPNEYHKAHMASMVLKMMHKAKDVGVIELYKSNDPAYVDGGQMRDFIYVKDAANMTFAFLENRSVCGLFNIGLGKATTWNALAEALFQSLGQKTNICYIDMPTSLARQYQNYTCAQMDKFHNSFQYLPYSIEEAVREYAQQYLLSDSRW